MQQANTKQVRAATAQIYKNNIVCKRKINKTTFVQRAFNVFASKRNAQQRTLTLYNTRYSNSKQVAMQNACKLRKLLAAQQLTATVLVVQMQHMQTTYYNVRVHCVAA